MVCFEPAGSSLSNLNSSPEPIPSQCPAPWLASAVCPRRNGGRRRRRRRRAEGGSLIFDRWLSFDWRLSHVWPVPHTSPPRQPAAQGLMLRLGLGGHGGWTSQWRRWRRPRPPQSCLWKSSPGRWAQRGLSESRSPFLIIWNPFQLVDRVPKAYPEWHDTQACIPISE